MNEISLKMTLKNIKDLKKIEKSYSADFILKNNSSSLIYKIPYYNHND